MSFPFLNRRNFFLVSIIVLGFLVRFMNISTNPPGLYWDEAAIGYDSYSILKTGADHRGHFLPLFFESFGDWKLPGYEYLSVPFIGVFGLNEFSVRLPNVIFGTLTVLLVYLLIKSQTKNYKLALSAAFLLAISPWHIQFSRAAFESTIALFTFTFALYLIYKSISSKNAKFLILGVILMALTQYIYHSYRIFTPMFLVGVGFIYRDFFLKFKKLVVTTAIIFLIVSIPIFIFSFTKEGKDRAISQSTFNQADFEKARLKFDQFSKPPFRFLSKYLYNKPLYTSEVLLKNYLDHFSPTFLFFKGDQVGRHSQVDIGQINIFELPLIIIGLFCLKNLKNRKFMYVLLLWLILAPIPAVIVNPTPHANRALQMVIPLVIISGIGLNYILFKSQKIIAALFCLWIVAVFLIYTNTLFGQYPKKFAADWQDGNRDMINFISSVSSKYKKVYVTNTAGVPYIYLLFYTKYDPSTYQKFGSTKGFGNYEFVDTNAKIYDQKNSLYVAPVWQKVNGNLQRVIYDSKEEPVYNIWELTGNK